MTENPKPKDSYSTLKLEWMTKHHDALWIARHATAKFQAFRMLDISSVLLLSDMQDVTSGDFWPFHYLFG